jgi:flagellar assembly factor FliW
MPEEAVALGLPYAETPSIGPEILPLTLVTLTEGAEPVANLMSPIVLNLQAHNGIQAIQLGSPYALRHPLAAECQAAPCS